jgi:predicted phosphodiesterase
LYWRRRDGYGSAQRCCDLLRQHRVPTVRGNHDRWFVEGALRTLADATHPGDLDTAAIQFLKNLPPTLEYSTPLGLLLLCHGLGTNDMAKVRDDDFGYALETNDDLQSLLRLAQYSIVVNGHSHYAMVRNFGSLTVVNAGTLKRDNEPCVLIVDFDDHRVDHLACVDGRFRPEPSRQYSLHRGGDNAFGAG